MLLSSVEEVCRLYFYIGELNGSRSVQAEQVLDCGESMTLCLNF